MREAAGLEGNETLRVTLELDIAKRKVEPPPDLVRALKAKPSVWQCWQELSYSHQREHVEAIEGAKKPETRLRGAPGLGGWPCGPHKADRGAGGFLTSLALKARFARFSRERNPAAHVRA